MDFRPFHQMVKVRKLEFQGFMSYISDHLGSVWDHFVINQELFSFTHIQLYCPTTVCTGQKSCVTNRNITAVTMI